MHWYGVQDYIVGTNNSFNFDPAHVVDGKQKTRLVSVWLGSPSTGTSS